MLSANIILEFIKIEDRYKFIGEVSEIKNTLSMIAKHSLATIQLLSLAQSNFILSSYTIIHDSYFAINCKLINNYLVIWKKDL